MKKYTTEYGLLKGIIQEEYYGNGILKECLFEEKCVIQTTLGPLIPRYDYSDTRSKYRNSLSFYESGKLKSIYLHEKTQINTPCGEMEVEMITFYEEERIHRVFPLYGQITAYWSEENERTNLSVFQKEWNGIQFQNKVTCYCYYPSRALKSLTFAAEESIIIETLYGKIEGRIGLSFYENGKIESMEPKTEISMVTPIGNIICFDNAPIGVHGDSNSLKFMEDGTIKSVKTIMTGIEIENESGEKIKLLPKRRRSFFDVDTFEMVPIELIFKPGKVEIQDSDGWFYEYQLDRNKIECVFNILYKSTEGCTDCAGCSGC